ncbi:helix-turn-helix domain-containing protein [Streptomyces sp. TRM 70361]|uniref:TetR/AcrR family transcriptional regulator n=1 Tax=Streptomyces sp. TRM 70361 TaxID=3116553 RepID=UPI002E7BBDF0|nr:helix-turn-helix domain-containing protein [Streptomyces sp. TRM 70361]MEE1942431.1 helix-turn-helix domain-containing protein [Streptomyces sp. TRM 70361]
MENGTEWRRITLTPAAARVLKAAERLFYERGIHAVGVDLIAAEAQVAKKTIYDRFGSKEQIVVEYLAARDERWREFLAGFLDSAVPDGDPAARVLAVFDASREWARENNSKGCGMVNAHAEISDPSHPAYAVITGQKRWMLALFTDLAREAADGADGTDGTAHGADAARDAGHALMLLHEGALVAHGLRVLPEPFRRAREQAGLVLEGLRRPGAPTAAEATGTPG